MLVGRVFRLRVDPAQDAALRRWAGICRSVWNTGLEQRCEYRRRGAFTSYAAQCRELADAKIDPVLGWLSDAPSHVLQQTLKDLDRAISFLVDDGILEVEPPVPDPRPQVGIDRGVKVALALSDGRMIDQAFTNLAEQQRLTRLQQQLSRQHGPRSKPSKQAQRKNPGARGRRQQPSNRWLATKAKITAIHARQRRRRDDFLAKQAHDLARDHSMVVLENLNTAGMTRRAAPKPDPNQPGAFLHNQQAQKAGLNRAILGKGWGKFALALAHQARYTGCRVEVVPAAHTSQRCHACGHTESGNRESQAVFRCIRCGHRANADVNAACNILAAGRAVHGRGSPTIAVGSVNHQDAA